jgi:hypothetical protein
MPFFRLAPIAACVFSSLFTLSVLADTPQTSFKAPHGLTVTVKQIGPVTQTTELQIVTLLKHNPQGDQYIEAMQDFNDKQGGLLQALRERGEFIGDLGETLLYTPPGQSITPRQVLLIGLGDEKDLSLDKLRVAGRIAIREAVRLNAHHVSFAPTLRDQGSSLIEVGAGDAAVVEQGLLAYDTEKRLQAQGLAPAFDIQEWVIEAGPKYYQSVNTQIERAIQQAGLTSQQKSTDPYVAASKK